MGGNLGCFLLVSGSPNYSLVVPKGVKRKHFRVGCQDLDLLWLRGPTESDPGGRMEDKEIIVRRD